MKRLCDLTKEIMMGFVVIILAMVLHSLSMNWSHIVRLNGFNLKEKI